MKVALSGAREQLLAVLRGDLDEVAQHVVVAHLERADAGLVRVARLQRRHHAARFIAQRAGLVERAVVAGAHEAAVALQIRQIVGKRRRERRDDGIVRRRERTRRLGDFVGRFQCGEAARQLLRRREPVADRRKIARAAALKHQPRQRAREIRRGRELRPDFCARPRRRRRTAPTASRRLPIAAGSVSGAASRWLKSRAPATVTVRSIASQSEPRRSPESVRISSRLARVAASMESVVAAASRVGGDSGGRCPSCVRST